MIGILLLGILGWVLYSNWDKLPGYTLPGMIRNATSASIPELTAIVTRMREQGITPQQVADAYAELSAQTAAQPGTPKDTRDITMKVFAYLGGIFVFSGIGVYVSMFWVALPPGMHLLLSLGLGTALTVLATIAIGEGKYPKIIMPLILIAACTQTSGWFIMLHDYFPAVHDHNKAITFVFAVMMIQQAWLFSRHKRTDFLFTAITAAYICFAFALQVLGVADQYIALLLGGCLIYTAHMLQNTPYRMLTPIGYFLGAIWFNTGLFHHVELISNSAWASMITGISFGSLAYGLANSGLTRVAGMGFFIGSALFYTGLFDWLVHTPFELLYLGVCVSMLYGAVLLKSRAVLFTSVVAILGFISYFSWKHFANSVGWPVSLILIGIAFFGVSAWAVNIKRTYKL